MLYCTMGYVSACYLASKCLTISTPRRGGSHDGTRLAMAKGYKLRARDIEDLLEREPLHRRGRYRAREQRRTLGNHERGIDHRRRGSSTPPRSRRRRRRGSKQITLRGRHSDRRHDPRDDGSHRTWRKNRRHRWRHRGEFEEMALQRRQTQKARVRRQSGHDHRCVDHGR